MKLGLTIQIRGGGTVRVGQPVAGVVRLENGTSQVSGRVTIEWEGPTPTSSVPPVSLHDGVIEPGAELELPFEVRAPSGPNSYDGELFQLDHALKARFDRPGFDVTAEEAVWLEGADTGAVPVGKGRLEVEDRISTWFPPGASSVVIIGFFALLGGLLTLVTDGPGTTAGIALLVGGALLGWQWLRQGAGRSLGTIRLHATSRIVRPGEQLDVQVQADADGGCDAVVARILCEERSRSLHSTSKSRPQTRVVEDSAFELRRERRGRWVGSVGVPDSHRPTLRVRRPDRGFKAGRVMEVDWYLSLEFYRGSRLLGQLRERLAMPAESTAGGRLGAGSEPPIDARSRPIPVTSDPKTIRRRRLIGIAAVAVLVLGWFGWSSRLPATRWDAGENGVWLFTDGGTYVSPYLRDRQEADGDVRHTDAAFAPFSFAAADEVERIRTQGPPLEAALTNLGRAVQSTGNDDVASWCWTPSPGGSGFIGCFGLYSRVDEAMVVDFDTLPGPPVDVRWINDTSALVVHGSDEQGYGLLIARLDGVSRWQADPPAETGPWPRPVVFAPADAPIVVVSWGRPVGIAAEPRPTYVVERVAPDRVHTFDLSELPRTERPLESQARAALLSPSWEGGTYETQDLWFSPDAHPLLGEGGFYWEEPVPLSDPYVPPAAPSHGEAILPTREGDRSFMTRVTTQVADGDWFVDSDPERSERHWAVLRLNHRYRVAVESDLTPWSTEFTREEIHRAGLWLWDEVDPLAPRPVLAGTDPNLVLFSGAVSNDGHSEETQYFMVDDEGRVLGTGRDLCGESPVASDLIASRTPSSERFFLTCETLFDLEEGTVPLPGGASRFTGWIGDRILKLDARDAPGMNAWVVGTDGSVEERFRYDGWGFSAFGEGPGVVRDRGGGRLVLPSGGECEIPRRVLVIDRDAELHRLEFSATAAISDGSSTVRWSQPEELCSQDVRGARFVGDLSTGVFTRVDGNSGG